MPSTGTVALYLPAADDLLIATDLDWTVLSDARESAVQHVTVYISDCSFTESDHADEAPLQGPIRSGKICIEIRLHRGRLGSSASLHLCTGTVAHRSDRNARDPPQIRYMADKHPAQASTTPCHLHAVHRSGTHRQLCARAARLTRYHRKPASGCQPSGAAYDHWQRRERLGRLSQVSSMHRSRRCRERGRATLEYCMFRYATRAARAMSHHVSRLPCPRIQPAHRL